MIHFFLVKLVVRKSKVFVRSSVRANLLHQLCNLRVALGSPFAVLLSDVPEVNV